MSDAPLMLGVSGMRGLVGRSLTPVVAARYGSAVGTWFKQTLRGATATPTPHIVIGRDSRPSGQWVAAAVASGLVATGCRVTDLGIVTTPAVAVMVEHLGADGGIVVTASHNPISWNGVKALRSDGVAPPPEQAQQIVANFRCDAFDYVPVEMLAPMSSDSTAVRVHVDRVLGHIDVAAIRAAKLTAVIDSVHGAGGEEAAALLDALGVRRVHLYAEPTGRFPHPPEPTREHLTELAAAVKQHGAAVGFAQDPDADRLAIVDDTGTYIGEEYTLALGALHLLSSHSAFSIQHSAIAVANLSTSRMLDDIAAQYGAAVIRTPVGEANVAAAMRQHHALIGGEGNGGIIWPDIIHVRDSIAGMALILELLATKKQPLSTIIKSIPSYAIVKDKLDAPGRDIPAILKKVSGTFSAPAPGSAPGSAPLSGGEAKLDTQDGVRLDWPDRWVHVRPSNTEPIIRIIAEAREEAAARELIERVRAMV